MTGQHRPLMPAQLENATRPRAGSWLDKQARRVGEVLMERYGLSGFDEDATYLTFAADIRMRRDAIALQMGITPISAQRYINEGVLERMAESVAEALGDEMIGGDPFGDTKTVPVDLATWSRAMWSLHLAAQALKPVNEDYAWSLAEIAGSMTSVLARQANADAGAGVILNVPYAGVAYVARACEGSAEMIEEWEVPLEGMTTTQLSDGLATDALELKTLL